MDAHGIDARLKDLAGSMSRRVALRRLGGGAVAALAAIGLHRTVDAQTATPMKAPTGWRTEHLEVEVTPVNAVTITRAGGGPPQRGDHFYVDAPIFAAGNVNGTQIGVYQCFGAWTHAATDTAAPDQRLTSVQFRFADGALMGLINEAGSMNFPGAVEGGTGKYANASGTFRQIVVSGPVPGVIASPAASPAPGTPAAGQTVVHTVFDLLLPAGG